MWKYITDLEKNTQKQNTKFFVLHTPIVKPIFVKKKDMKIRNLMYVVLSALLMACSNYGDKVVINNVDIYYKDGVSKELAEKLGRFLEENDFNENGTEKSVQLSKVKDKDEYIFKMVIKDDAVGNPEYEYAFETMSRVLEPVLGKPVTVQVCDEYFKPLKTFEASKSTKALSQGGVELVFTRNIQANEAQAVLNYWSEIASEDAENTIMLDKQDGKYIFKMVILEEYYKDTSLDYAFLELKNAVKEVLKTSDLDLILCDDDMITVRKL